MFMLTRFRLPMPTDVLGGGWVRGTMRYRLCQCTLRKKDSTHTHTHTVAGDFFPGGKQFQASVLGLHRKQPTQLGLQRGS